MWLNSVRHLVQTSQNSNAQFGAVRPYQLYDVQHRHLQLCVSHAKLCTHSLCIAYETLVLKSDFDAFIYNRI